MKSKLIELADATGLGHRDLSKKPRFKAVGRKVELTKLGVQFINNFLNSADDSMFLFDKGLRLIGINKAALNTFGIKSRKRVMGKELLDLCPSLRDSTRYTQYKEVMETGNSLIIDDLNDGEKGSLKSKLLQIKAFRVGNGLGIIARDMTSHHEAEKVLEESELKYKFLIDNIPDAIYSLDKNGCFTSMSDHGLTKLGYKRSELIGQHFIKIIYPEDAPIVLETFKRGVYNHEEKQALKFRIMTKDQHLIWVSLNVTLLFDEDGNFLQEQGVARDITEQRISLYQFKIEQRLRAAIVNMVHFVELLGQKSEPTADQQRYIELILGTGKTVLEGLQTGKGAEEVIPTWQEEAEIRKSVIDIASKEEENLTKEED